MKDNLLIQPLCEKATVHNFREILETFPTYETAWYLVKRSFDDFSLWVRVDCPFCALMQIKHKNGKEISCSRKGEPTGKCPPIIFDRCDAISDKDTYLDKKTLALKYLEEIKDEVFALDREAK